MPVASKAVPAFWRKKKQKTKKQRSKEQETLAAETRGAGVRPVLVKDGSLSILFFKELWRI